MIRVLRIIEYKYNDPKWMAEDMRRWTNTLNNKWMSMTSVHMLPDWMDDEDLEVNDQGESPGAPGV